MYESLKESNSNSSDFDNCRLSVKRLIRFFFFVCAILKNNCSSHEPPELIKNIVSGMQKECDFSKKLRNFYI